jgi:hypothetical protein
MNRPGENIGLLWVGQAYYKKSADFEYESFTQGISKRIAAVPRNFQVGKTWIALAHPTACDGLPGIFTVFRPSAIEYIVRGNESEQELNALEKRGLTLIHVIPEGLQAEMELDSINQNFPL